MEKKPAPARKIFVFLFLLLCVFAGGCRLFRFLEAKDQLRNFGENFEASDRDGLRLVFKNPVLLSGDISWLMVYSPPEKTRLGEDAELWTYRLVKRYPGARGETGDFDLVLGMKFVSGKLGEVVFPERLTRYLDGEVFGKIMNSMGQANVSKLSRTTTGTVGSLRPADIPTSEDALAVLGVPYGRETRSEGDVFTYRYRLGEKTPKGGYVFFRLVLGFDAETRRLKKLVLPLRSVKLTMNFDPGAADR